MKKVVFVLMLVAILLSLSLSLISAAMDFEDPCVPGSAKSEHAKCHAVPPPGLRGNDHGKAGDNWLPPQ